MRTQFLLQICVWVAGFSSAATLSWAADTAKFQSLGQYTRIQIPATSGSTFRLVNGNGNETTVVLDRVRPGSLDALPVWSDARVKGVKVNSTGLDSVQIQVSFQQGGIESFAYMQGDMLVLDLWKGDSSQTAAAPVQAGAEKELPSTVKGKKARVAKAASKTESTRSPATVVKAAPAAKPVRALERDRDVFQRFVLPMPELRIEAKGGGFDLPPKGEIEGLWEFTKDKADTEEARAYEFAKKLYLEKKYGLAIKSIEIVRRDFPKSPHLDELHFIEALSYRNLGENTHTAALTEKSESMLEELGMKRDEKGNPVPFNGAIRLYFGQKDYNQGNWLSAISHLEYVAGAIGPEDPKFPYVQIMLAEAYGKVNQPRRAERVYRYLSDHFPKNVIAKEARYRIADLLALDRNYNRVTEEGEAAIATFPDYEKKRAEVLFEMGEANFWLKNYAKAEKYFRRFTELSSATNAALAWVRIGEILEVSKGNTKAAREAYMKAKNGFPFSQGDLVATVRLARIDVPTEKEPEFIVNTLDQLLKDKTIDADLRRMAELTLADYLLLTGAVDKATELARSGMAQTEGATFDVYKQVYMRALFAKLVGLNHEKHFAEALALYDRERKWFDQYGAESFRAVADTYRGLGLYATSNDLMERYGRESKGRGIASRDRDDALSQAKAKNSFARGAYADVLQNLPTEDADGDNLSMRAISEFRLGKKAEAAVSATKAVAAAANDKQSDETLSELAEILIDRAMTERDFGRMEKDVSVVRKLMEKSDERLAFAAADALWYQKKHAAAIAAYKEALTDFPKAAERGARARYNMGMSFVSLGKREEAVKQLTELRDSGQSVWAESAKQELELMDWEKKYSSVLRTLPPSGLGITN